MRKKRKFSPKFKIQCVKKILEEHISKALNGWIKEELYIDFGLSRSKNVPQLINNYITYFNNYRLSSKLHYKTPAQFRIEQGFA